MGKGDFTICDGPFGLVDEATSSKDLSPVQLAAGKNIMLREGRIRPRPGRVAHTDDSFAHVLEIVHGGLRTLGAIAWSPGNGRIYRTNRYGANKRIQSLLPSRSVTSLTVLGGLTDPTGLAVSDASPGYCFYVDHPQIRRVAYDGTGDAALVADGGSGSPWQIMSLALTVNQSIDYLFWATQQKIVRSTDGGGSVTDLITTGAPWAVCVRDTTVPYLFWIDRNGNHAIRRSDLTGAGTVALYTAASGQTLWGLCHSQAAPGRVFWSETGAAFTGIKSCIDDGSDLRTILTRSLVSPRQLAYDAARDELYLTDVSGDDERLFRISAAIAPNVAPISAYSIHRSVFGVTPPPPFDDFTLLQLRNSTRGRSDYVLRFPLSGDMFLARMGCVRGGVNVPNVWCTNSRNARVDATQPFSVCAGKAAMAYLGRGMNSGSGGTLIAEGSVDRCALADSGIPPETIAAPASLNEIQRLDIGEQSGGAFKIRVDTGGAGGVSAPYALTGTLSYQPTAADVALAVGTAMGDADGSNFSVTGPDAGGGNIGTPFTIEGINDRADTSLPMMEGVDYNLSDPENILPVTRLQSGRDATVSPPVNEIHALDIVNYYPNTSRFRWRIPFESGVILTSWMTKLSGSAEVIAALGTVYDTSHIVVQIVSTGSTWSVTIEYGGDYAGRTFNVPEFDFEDPLSITFGQKHMRRLQTGIGVEMETVAVPANLGLGLPDNPFVANYCLGDTVQTLTFTAAGPITLELAFGNEVVVSGIFENDVGADGLRDLLEGLGDGPSLGDQICVHCDEAGGAGHEVYTLRFSGVWSGQCVPLLKVRAPVYAQDVTSPPAPGAAEVALLQPGGTKGDATFFLRPTNLPRITGVFARAATIAAPGMSGTYDYVLCANSKIFRLTGPPSVVSDAVSVHETGIQVGYAVPETLWFDESMGADVEGGHVRTIIPKLHLYRRRLGNYNRTNTIWRLRHYYNGAYIEFEINLPRGTTGIIRMDDKAFTETPGATESSTEGEIVDAFSQAGYEVIVTRVVAADEDDEFHIEFIGSDSGKLIGLLFSSVSVNVITTTVSGGTGIEQLRNTYIQRGGQTLEVDGSGASNWLKVAEIRVDPSQLGMFQYYTDTLSDAEFVSDEAAPFENGYPPADAEFVVMHGGLAVYAAGNRVHISETVKVGGADDGQLGGEYVRSTSYEALSRDLPSDGSIRGLLSIDRILLIGGADRVIEGTISAPTVPQKNNFRPLAGVRGFAGHFAVVELKNRPGALWFGDDGRLYRYEQGRAVELTRNLLSTAETLTARVTVRREIFDTPDSWHFVSCVSDPFRDYAYFSVIRASDSSRFLIVVDLLRNEWAPWDISATCLWLERNENSAHGKVGGDIVTLATASGIERLVDGKGDRGAAFPWEYSFGKLAYLGAGRFQGAVFAALAMDFEARSFGGADAGVSVDVTGEGQTKTVIDVGAVGVIDGLWSDAIDLRDRRMRIRVHGTQSDDQTHAELLGYEVGRREEGPRNRPGT